MNENSKQECSATDSFQLIDGQPPATARQVIERLDSMGIENSTIDHAPMRTVEDSKQFRYGVPGGYSKNLFLRNRKGKMWLVTLHEDRVIDLRSLGDLIGAGRVSFCSETRLMNYLGIKPGAVSPLAVINDHTCAVNVVMDLFLLSLDPLHFHPCDNSKTTTLKKPGLLQYMEGCGHIPVMIDFDTAVHS